MPLRVRPTHKQAADRHRGARFASTIARRDFAGGRPMVKTNAQLELEAVMGKYVLAWLLGVPAFVLVIIYFFAH